MVRIPKWLAPVGLVLYTVVVLIIGSIPNPQQGISYAEYIPATGGQGVYPTSGTFSVGISNTPAVQGSVSINNTPGVVVQNTIPVSFPTSTLGVNVANTIGVREFNTVGVQVLNTPAVQGSVSVNNTPAVQGSVSINNTPAVQGSVSINNTPAVQGSVSINNTPAVSVQNTVPVSFPTTTIGVREFNTVGVQVLNTPAIQGSVSINNTPAVQGSISINNTPAIQGSVSINNTIGVTLTTPVPVSTSTIVQPFNSLVQSGLTAFAYDVLKKIPGAYWRMGESSGNLADSANSNTASQVGTGKTYGVLGSVVDDANTAITMPGATTDYYTVATNATIPSGDIFTIVFAFQRGNTATLQYLYSQAANGFQVLFSAADKLTLAKNGVGNIFVETAAITDTNWHLGVFTKSGATTTLYVDGVNSAGTTTNQTIAPADASGRIGISSATTSPFTGTLDEYALWTRVLSAAEVTDLYNTWIEAKAAAVPMATGSANFFMNVGPQATFPVSFPTSTLGVSVQNTVGAQIFNTPAVQGSVSINNTPGVSVQNTPAVQGSVSINNTPGVSIQNTPMVQFSTSDPCQNPGNLKASTPLAMASATTAVLVGSSGSNRIYVCGVAMSMATAGTFELIQASGTASAVCPTAVVNLTGTFSGQVGGVSAGWGGSLAVVGAGNKLCAIAGGTAVNAQGIVTYVQAP